jgi:dephospho-CoA kinase
MQRPYIVAVTGGIASGKSAVTERLVRLGVPVLDADLVARELVEPGELALAQIAAAFGPSVIDADGRLDRAALRAIVFADDGARARLNAILHPRVHDRLRARAAVPGPVYVVVAIPLLAEALQGEPGRYAWLDRIVVVDVPRELQLARVMQRDGADRAAAERLLAAQASRAQRLAVADEVIVNDGPLERLDGVVERLHARCLALARTAGGYR